MIANDLNQAPEPSFDERVTYWAEKWKDYDLSWKKLIDIALSGYQGHLLFILWLLKHRADLAGDLKILCKSDPSFHPTEGTQWSQPPQIPMIARDHWTYLNSLTAWQLCELAIKIGSEAYSFKTHRDETSKLYLYTIAAISMLRTFPDHVHLLLNYPNEYIREGAMASLIGMVECKISTRRNKRLRAALLTIDRNPRRALRDQLPAAIIEAIDARASFGSFSKYLEKNEFDISDFIKGTINLLSNSVAENIYKDVKPTSNLSIDRCDPDGHYLKHVLRAKSVEGEELFLREEARQESLKLFTKAGLSPDELQIVVHKARGLKDPDIAELIGKKVNTVYQHMSRIRKKLKGVGFDKLQFP